MLMELKVKRQGITVLGVWYYHPKLAPYLGEHVIVKQKKKHQELGYLKVYDRQGNKICTAIKEPTFAEETKAEK